MGSAHRVPIGASAAGQLAGFDYADAFEVASTTSASAEQRLRGAFGSVPGWLTRLVVVVHRRVLGFRLASGPEHPIGWTIIENTRDLVVLAADGPLMTGRLIVEAGPDATRLSTLLRYRRRSARPVWAVVGIAHRAIAPWLLARAARAMSGSDQPH